MAKRGASMPQDDSEYELVPAKTVKRLAKDVEAIKKDPLGATPQGQDLLAAVNSLSTTINDLTGMFKEAAESMHEEEEETHGVGEQLKPLVEKVDMLIEQNKKIARAIIAVSDKVDEMQQELQSRQPSMPARPMGQAPMPPPGMSEPAYMPGEPLLQESREPPFGGLRPAPLGAPYPGGPGGPFGMPPPGGSPRWTPPPIARPGGPGRGMEIPPPPGAPARPPKKKGLFSF